MSRLVRLDQLWLVFMLLVNMKVALLSMSVMVLATPDKTLTWWNPSQIVGSLLLMKTNLNIIFKKQNKSLRHVQTCAILLIFFMLTELNLDAFLFHVIYYNCGVWVVIFFFWFLMATTQEKLKNHLKHNRPVFTFVGSAPDTRRLNFSCGFW